MQTKLKKKGFTLVELVVVVAVIAVLSAILIPSIGCFVEDAKETNDAATVRLLNVALVEDQAENGQPATMTDALAAMARKGYNIEKLTPRSSGDILWDSVNNRFALYKGDNPVYSDNSVSATDKVNLWKIVDADSLDEVKTELAKGEYSYYLKGNGISGDIGTITTGLDVGNNTGITAIKYENSGNIAQNVVIRTNSAYTTLTIDGYVDSTDNTKGDVISHYDSLGGINVTKVAYGCYYEYGTTAYAVVAAGKIVAKEGGEISALYATAPMVVAKVDGGIICDAYCISTESVETNNDKDSTTYYDGYTNFSDSKGGNIIFKYTVDGTTTGTGLTAEKIADIGNEEIFKAKKEEIGEISTFYPNAIAANINTGKYFDTLADALSNSDNNETIILVANTKENVIVENDVIIDLNGKTVKADDEDKAAITIGNASDSKNANAKIVDTNEKQTGLIDSVKIDVGSDATVQYGLATSTSGDKFTIYKDENTSWSYNEKHDDESMFDSVYFKMISCVANGEETLMKDPVSGTYAKIPANAVSSGVVEEGEKIYLLIITTDRQENSATYDVSLRDKNGNPFTWNLNCIPEVSYRIAPANPTANGSTFEELMKKYVISIKDRAGSQILPYEIYQEQYYRIDSYDDEYGYFYYGFDHLIGYTIIQETGFIVIRSISFS